MRPTNSASTVQTQLARLARARWPFSIPEELLWPSVRSTLRQWIDQAGKPLQLTVSQWVSLWLTSLSAAWVALIAVGLLSLLATIGVWPWLVVGAVCAVLIAWPFMALNQLRRQRERAIVRALPFFIDLLTLSVDAGLSLEQALQRITPRFTGPLGQELRSLVVAEQLGVPRTEALQILSARSSSAELRNFATYIIQANQLGTSLSDTLRIQAGLMRSRRRANAETAGRRASVLIVIPLTLCLLPSFCLILAGPPMVHLWELVTGIGP